MSSFVANGAPTPAQDPISAGPFWPDIDVNALRDAIRVPGDVLPARLRQTVLAALISVTRELDAWQAKQMAEGYATLDQVPARRIDGRSVLEHLFHRAVQCAAAVELHERYRAYDATAQGNQRADDLSPTIDEMRRDLRNAISDLLGTGRVTVELI